MNELWASIVKNGEKIDHVITFDLVCRNGVTVHDNGDSSNKDSILILCACLYIILEKTQPASVTMAAKRDGAQSPLRRSQSPFKRSQSPFRRDGAQSPFRRDGAQSPFQRQVAKMKIKGKLVTDLAVRIKNFDRMDVSLDVKLFMFILLKLNEEESCIFHLTRPSLV